MLPENGGWGGRNIRKHRLAGGQMRANSEMPIWYGEQEAWSSTKSMPLAGTAWLLQGAEDTLILALPQLPGASSGEGHLAAFSVLGVKLG